METVRAGGDLSRVAADTLERALRVRLSEKERVSLAVSGGRTPWPVFERLSEAELDWPRIDIYQVDERVAPSGDPARNLVGLSNALLSRVDTVVHPMAVEDSDLEAAAARYAALLPASLDVIHLGLGDDGHTASLVPNDPVLDERERLVAVTAPYRGHRRMTLTFPALDRAGAIVWIVAGDDKRAMLDRLRSADPTIPAGRVSQAHAVLLTDEAV